MGGPPRPGPSAGGLPGRRAGAVRVERRRWVGLRQGVLGASPAGPGARGRLHVRRGTSPVLLAPTRAGCGAPGHARLFATARIPVRGRSCVRRGSPAMFNATGKGLAEIMSTGATLPTSMSSAMERARAPGRRRAGPGHVRSIARRRTPAGRRSTGGRPNSSSFIATRRRLARGISRARRGSAWWSATRRTPAPRG